MPAAPIIGLYLPESQPPGLTPCSRSVSGTRLYRRRSRYDNRTLTP